MIRELVLAGMAVFYLSGCAGIKTKQSNLKVSVKPYDRNDDGRKDSFVLELINILENKLAVREFHVDDDYSGTIDSVSIDCKDKNGEIGVDGEIDIPNSSARALYRIRTGNRPTDENMKFDNYLREMLKYF